MSNEINEYYLVASNRLKNWLIELYEDKITPEEMSDRIKNDIAALLHTVIHLIATMGVIVGFKDDPEKAIKDIAKHFEEALKVAYASKKLIHDAIEQSPSVKELLNQMVVGEIEEEIHRRKSRREKRDD